LEFIKKIQEIKWKKPRKIHNEVGL
jgi:hypothetical protein